MNKPALCLRAYLLAAALTVAAAPGRADAAWSEVLRDGMDAAQEVERTLREQAEQAIVMGGVLLYRHRHTVAGAVLGCVAGSLVATTTTLGAGLVTGGASLMATAPGAALGCGLGAVGGAVIGAPLDSVYDLR
jgi:hypothetical protein